MKILYYIPVNSKHIKKWEFYKPDIDALSEFNSVKVINNLFTFLRYFISYDLIYCSWWGRSFPAILFSKIFLKKVICTGAIHFEDKSGEKTWFTSSWLYKVVNFLSLKLTDINICVSKSQLIDLTKKLGLTNCYLIPLKLNKNYNKIISKKIKKKFFKKKRLILTSILWLTKSSFKRKGLFQTLDALLLLKEEKKIFKYNIIGQKGDGIDLLKNEIKKRGLDKNIEVFINASFKKKTDLLKTTHLYLQPSFCEAFGYSVLEASALNVLSLVSNKTAQIEIISAHELTVSKVDSNHIYRCIIKYLKIGQKKEMLLLKKLQAHIKNKYSYQHHVEDMKKLIAFAKGI